MDPIIRHAEDKDKSGVLSLLNNTYSDIQRSSTTRNVEYWNWKYLENPFGKSILTVAEINQKIVGVNNLWPWEFNIRGQVIKALQPCDSVIHKDYRGKGLFKNMRLHGLEIACENDYQLIFNFPNKNSLPAYLSLGWHFQGEINWLVKILKPVKILHGMLHPSKTDQVFIDEKYSIDTKILDEISNIDANYDGFLKINRIAGFHKWRYVDHPYRSYGMLLYDKGNKSTAAIFTLNQKGANREMVIVDIIGSTSSTIPIMKMAKEAGSYLGVSYIAVMNNPRFKTSELWKIGFLKRKYKNMVVLPINLILEPIVKKYSNWSLMAGIHDSI